MSNIEFQFDQIVVFGDDEVNREILLGYIKYDENDVWSYWPISNIRLTENCVKIITQVLSQLNKKGEILVGEEL